MFKELYKSANRKILISPELIEKTENKINQQSNGSSLIQKPFYKYGALAISVCLAIVLFLAAGIPNFIKGSIAANKSSAPKNSAAVNGPISPQGSGKISNSPPKNVSNGLAMGCYYRYNGNYYSLKDAEPDIQKNISKHLYGDFYEIKGVDSSKSIALFINSYYWKLDYYCKDTVIFQGKPYLFNIDSINTPGKYLGDADQHKIYELTGSDVSRAILVKVGSRYCAAYQYPSLISLKGITYELATNKNKIGSNNSEQYIGTAGQYKAYKYNNNDIAKTVMIHINDSEEVKANAITTTYEAPIPKSRYGSVYESMYPTTCTVQWKGHGIYMCGAPDEYESDSLKKQLGKQLGYDSYDGYNYVLYEMKGTDTSNSIIVKNNLAYLKYNFVFSDTITFNGHTYILGETKENYVRGKQIGMAGPYKAYEIKDRDPSKGVDPSKAIFVIMSGYTELGGMEGTFVAYRVDK